MTVQEQSLVQYYDGPISSGTVLPIVEFSFLENSHVAAKIRGLSTNLVYGTDYTISGAQTLDRNITLLTDIADTEVLAVFLDVPITQGVSPEEGGNFPAAVQEYSFDKLTQICAKLYERVTRAFQASIDSTFDGTLYGLNDNPGKALIVNATGTGVTYSEESLDNIVSAVEALTDEAEGYVQDASNSASAAAQSAVDAQDQVALATTQANLAQDQVVLATTQAGLAEGSALSADDSADRAEAAASSLEDILPVSGDEGKFLQVATPYTNGYDKLTIRQLANTLALPITPNSVNSAKVNASGYADFIAKVDDTSVTHYAGGSNPNIVETDVLGRTHTITADETITGMTNNGTYEMLKEYDLATGVALASAPVAVLDAKVGKDLKVSFERGDATDDYGLHTPTIVGSPTFTGNKFNSNGNSGISYPITVPSGSTFCFLAKIKSTNTSTVQIYFAGTTSWAFVVQKGTANKLQLYLGNNGTSMNLVAGTSSGLGSKSDWAVGTEYYIKFYNTGSAYKVDWSTNTLSEILAGTATWNNDINFVSGSAILASTSVDIALSANTSPLIGTIDDIQVTIGNSTIINKNTVKEVQVLDTATFNDGDYRTVTGVQPNRQYKKSGGVTTETTFIRRGQVAKTAGTMGTPVSYAFGGYAESAKGMPSNRYIDLTLGVSGSTYTAPSNGWVAFFKNSTAASQYMSVYGASAIGFSNYSTAGSQQVGSYIPVKKDDVVSYSYNLAGTTVIFRFYYAQGVN